MHTPRDYAAVFSARNRVIRGLCFDVLRGPLKGSLDVSLGSTEDIKDESPEDLLELSPRLGLIVPKRLARRAVLRNTIKRQIRESFRLCDQGALPAVDLVFRLTRWPQSVSVLVSTPSLLKKLLRQEIEDLLLKIQSFPGVVVASKD